MHTLRVKPTLMIDFFLSLPVVAATSCHQLSVSCHIFVVYAHVRQLRLKTVFDHSLMFTPNRCPRKTLIPDALIVAEYSPIRGGQKFTDVESFNLGDNFCIYTAGISHVRYYFTIATTYLLAAKKIYECVNADKKIALGRSSPTCTSARVFSP